MSNVQTSNFKCKRWKKNKKKRMFKVATPHMPLSKQQPTVTPAKKTFSR